MRYFDSSALAKKYVDELWSRDVLRLLRSAGVATSRLSEVEIASALARLERDAAISQSAHRAALTALQDDLEAWTIVELTPQLASEARALVQRRALRAGDGVQLASCLQLQRRSAQNVEMVAFDDRLARAARAEGLTVRDSF